MRKLLILLYLFSISLPLISDLANAIEKPQEEMSEVGLDTKLGNKVNLDLKFTTSDGETKTLKEITQLRKPIIITPVYYDCPRLCGLLLSGATKLFNNLNLKLGEEYEIVTVSFDQTEGPDKAKKRELEYKEKLTRPGANHKFWHFLVGTQENISVLMREIGFKYQKDKEEFAHTAAIIILTPEGEISQYFTGIEFSAWDVRLAVIEASQGKVGSLIDHFLLYCFRYDHAEGKYTWAVFSVMRVAGLASILILLSVIYWASRGKKTVGTNSLKKV